MRVLLLFTKIELKEVETLLDETQKGNWIPLGIILLLLSVIGVLLLSRYTTDKKDNKKIQAEHSQTIKVIADTNNGLEKMLEKHELRLDVNDREIKDIRRKIG